MKWLAVCSNGAVALGAYEAGVLAQIFADVVAANKNGSVVGIDAIAGASAGAVTGALLSQAIVTGEAPGAFTKRVCDTWITGLSADTLLGATGNDAESLFDPATLDALAPKVILGDAQMAARCACKEVPPVTLSIALTNVDGIPFTIDLNGGDVFATLYADYDTFVIEGGVPHMAPGVETLSTAGAPIKGTPVSWNVVQQTAITSAAFPFAFRSQVIERDLSQYANAVFPAGNPNQSFNYVDGGVLNNDPIGRAIDAATFQEEAFGHLNEDRTFLIIDPDPTSRQQALEGLEGVQKSLSANGLPLPSLGGKVIGAYFNDALYRDLQQAIQANKRIAALDGILDPLVKAGTINEVQATSIRAAVGLDYKKPIVIERVPSLPRPFKLAGAFAGHFGGFFNQQYRESDFQVGCYEARVWFRAWINAQAPTSAALLDGNLQSGLAEAVQPPLPAPGGFVGIPANELSATKDKVADRVEALAEHLFESSGLWGILEKPLFAVGRHVVREELDELMK